MYFISIRYNNDEESNEEEEDDEEEEEEEEEEEAQKEIYSVSSTSEPDEEVSTDEDGHANEVRDVQVKIEVGDQQIEDKDDGSFMEEDEVVHSDEDDESVGDDTNDVCNKFGFEVNTTKNPNYEVIAAMFLDDKATTVHVTVPGSNEVEVYYLDQRSHRTDLKSILANPKSGSRWKVWLKEVNEEMKSSLAPGFTLPPSNKVKVREAVEEAATPKSSKPKKKEKAKLKKAEDEKSDVESEDERILSKSQASKSPHNSKTRSKKKVKVKDSKDKDSDYDADEKVREHKSNASKMKQNMQAKKADTKIKRHNETNKKVKSKGVEVKQKRSPPKAGCKMNNGKKQDNSDDDNNEEHKGKASKSKKGSMTKRAGEGGGKASTVAKKVIKAGKKGKEQNKKETEGVEESDSGCESDSIFGAENLLEHLNKQVVEKSKRPFGVFSTPIFHNVVKKESVWSVSFDRPGNIFYAKGEHQQSVIQYLHERKAVGNINHIPSWITSIRDVKIRKMEHGKENVWKRTGLKNNTTEVVHFVISVPTDEEETFHALLNNCIDEYFCKAFRKRKGNSAGDMALAYVEALHLNDTGSGGGLIKFVLNAKGNGDRDEAVKTMNKELHNHFKDGPAYHYDVPLDKFMCDWDIKHFLNNYVGVDSWDDLNNEEKKACYRDYPAKKLPQWDSIVQESY